MFKCEFCNKTFKTEGGFNRHCCEKKKRYEEFNQLGYAVWLMIRKIYNIGIPTKDEESRKKAFVKDRFYNDIIKFANWIIETNIFNPYEYMVYLQQSDTKMSDWTNPRYYRMFLIEFMVKEPATIARLRAKDYLEKHNLQINNLSSNRLYLLIKYGIISYKVLQENELDVKSVLDEGQYKDILPFLHTWH